MVIMIARLISILHTGKTGLMVFNMSSVDRQKSQTHSDEKRSTNNIYKPFLCQLRQHKFKCKAI